ncbi:TonB-dependent receptor [Parabacteroides pacaensis]|uniref:TonB-dependent receptor n=1 Tax=Parabacteroides pacaensis TaxID=2086575 RepID=UPI000D10AE2C|nr:TonB-dependent receptor [Parabacteroides pacaensis]
MGNNFIVNRKRAKLPKILLIISFFTASILPLLANESLSYAQTKNITVKAQNKTVKEVFDYIEKNSEFVFLYYDGMLDTQRKVSIDISKQPITQILDQLFKGTNLSYEIADRQVVIMEKSSKPSPQQSSKKFMLKGKVLDDTGAALPGATVMVSGSTRGVITDIDGSFEIEVTPSDKLTVAFLGMKDQTIQVGTQKMLVVKMEQKVDELQEVTVVAYGRQKKESVIGAITTIGSDELKLPVAKLSTGLAGQLAGIVAMQRTGEPGAGADFWIRGVSSFGANTTPLILVDGIERSMDLVDPEDIATFSILKDATATALYGVRGANGIILITTKRGKEAPPAVNARVEYGISSPTRMPKLANGGQWMDYYNDISLANGGNLAYQPTTMQKYLSGTDPDLYPVVDWMDMIFKNTSNNLRVNVNVTGGGKRVRYYVGGSYYNEGGVFNPADNLRFDPQVKYQKFNFRANVDIDITKSTELGVSLSNQYEVKRRLGIDMATMYNNAVAVPPTAVVPIYSDGTLTKPNVGSNPFMDLNYTGFSQDFWNNAQALVSLTQDFSEIITPGLKANIKFSWDARNESTEDKRMSPSTYLAAGRDENGNLILNKNYDGNDYMRLAVSNRGSHSMNLEASGTYERVFDEKHRVGGLFLFTMREYKNNFPGDYIQSFPEKNIGIAGRATYSFMDKYFAEFNFGYNGSENFAPDKQFGFFPSGAIGYMISNEDFWQPISHIVNLLKFKGSYGEIGNDKIGGNRRFAFNSEMSTGGGYPFGRDNIKNIGGIATGHPGNPDVSWETAKKSDVGFELGLFNQFKLNMDYFYEKREGIYIQQQSVPSIVGINVTQYVNLGRMKNQGIDMSVEYDKQINKDWYISARGNFTFNRNKRLYDDAPTPVWPYRSSAGFPQSQLRGLIAMGLFESEEDLANSPKQTFGETRIGDIKYRDINSDGVIDENDKIAIGYTNLPEINYGFGLSARWKNFDASVFFQGVGNVSRVIAGDNLYGTNGSILSYGQIYEDVAENRWNEFTRNPDSKYPRMSMVSNANNSQSSTFWLRDMSFIRLKNAEIGYSLPRELVRKAGLSTLRFYVQGVNLFTLSEFKLWDPELNTDHGNIYPQMRNVIIGMNLNF